MSSASLKKPGSGRNAGKYFAILGGAAIASTLLASRTAMATIVTSGVNFAQQSFNWDTDTDNHSVDAQVGANLSALDTAAGVGGSGFLNIATSSGWVVQNMYVANASEAADMLLPSADGTTDNSVSATVDFSSLPSSTFTNSSPHVFGVSQVSENPEGFGASDPTAGYKPSQAANTLTFGLNPIFNFNFQPGHGNIQAADNQCFPAAVANSLAWLRTTQGLNFRQTDGPGLGNVGSNGLNDGTIVGTLDADMNRGVTNRSSGSPVDSLPGLQGKLRFLADNNITNVSTNYQGTTGSGGALPASVSVTSSGRTATANSSGGVITASFIQSEIAAGEDVELGYIGGGGGHFVEVTGAGSVGGIPWITYVSDLLQTPLDPTDTLGTDTTNFSFLADTNANGTLNLVNEAGMPEATFLISESAVPEPLTLSAFVLASGLLALKRKRRRQV